MAAAFRIIRTCFFLLLVSLQGGTLHAQSSYLSRKVSVNLPSCSLEVALDEIAKAGNFRFSYDTDLIPANRQVTVKAQNTQVNTLLKPHFIRAAFHRFQLNCEENY